MGGVQAVDGCAAVRRELLLLCDVGRLGGAIDEKERVRVERRSRRGKAMRRTRKMDDESERWEGEADGTKPVRGVYMHSIYYLRNK